VRPANANKWGRVCAAEQKSAAQTAETRAPFPQDVCGARSLAARSLAPEDNGRARDKPSGI